MAAGAWGAIAGGTMGAEGAAGAVGSEAKFLLCRTEKSESTKGLVLDSRNSESSFPINWARQLIVPVHACSQGAERSTDLFPLWLVHLRIVLQ